MHGFATDDDSATNLLLSVVYEVVLPFIDAATTSVSSRGEGDSGAQVIYVQIRAIANALQQIGLMGFEFHQTTEDV